MANKTKLAESSTTLGAHGVGTHTKRQEYAAPQGRLARE